MILVETHLTGRCGIRIPNYKNIAFCNRKGKRGGGLLVAIREDSNINMIITELNVDNDQMWVKLNTSTWSCHLGVVYGLHETRHTDDEIDEWFFKLESTISKLTSEPILIIGDMNAHMGNDENGIAGNHGEINKNGKWWRDIIERREITLINDTELSTGKWTRNSLTGKKSILDLVLCNEQMCSSVRKMCIDEEGSWTLSRFHKIDGKTVETPSDHNPIVIELAGKQEKAVAKEKVWRISDANLEVFKKHTDTNPMKEQWNRGGDVNVKYKRWSKQLRGLMYRFFTRATKKHNKHNKVIKNKIQLKNAIKKEIKKIQKDGPSGGSLENDLNNKFNAVLEEIGEEIIKEKREKIQRRMEKITSKCSTATNEIWKVRRNVLSKPDQKMAVEDKSGNLLTNKIDILNRHNEYYETLLKTRDPEPISRELNDEIEKQFIVNMDNLQYDSDIINTPFTEAELEKVISKLKSHKCPGRDEITNEMLKSAGKELKKSLLKMFNWFWIEEKIPDELLKLNIKTLYKGKGKTSQLTNHRGIFLGSEIMKMYEKLIYNRIILRLEKGMSEFQAGGRAKRSISDHVFIIRSIMQHYRYINIQLLLEFIDLIKAFDKMSLKHVLNDIWRCEIKGKIWRTIYKVNSHSNISIKTAVGNSPEFEIGESLKQGSVLATALAAYHTDTITPLFDEEGLGVIYGNLRINCLLFQDDIVKLETNSHNLNKSNTMLNHFRQKNLMEFHPDKSKYMNTFKHEEKIIIGNTKLAITQRYEYLGDVISADGRLMETIDQRSKSCTATVAELNAIIEETVAENILIDAVVTYHNSIIIPKLCLNSETWSLNKTEIQMMETTQNKSIKRMLRLPQGTPSQGLRAELGIYSIESVISIRKLRFLHRVLNLPDRNITKQVLMQQLNLPGETWFDNTIALCTKFNLSEDIEVIANTSKLKWKELISEAIAKDESNKLIMWAENSKKYNSAHLSVKKKKYIDYLPPSLAMTILKARTGMTEVKANFKNMHTDLLCRKCRSSEENLLHILRCNTRLSDDEDKLIQQLTDILVNIEEKEPTQVRTLAQLICREIQMMKDRDTLLVDTSLESRPRFPRMQATSEEEDTR